MKYSALIDNLREKIQTNHDYYEGCYDIKPNKGFHTLWLCGLAVIRSQEKKDITLNKIKESAGSESFEHWCASDHNDCVLAIAIALWYAEKARW